MNEPMHPEFKDPRRLIVGVGYLGSRVAKMWANRCETLFGTTRKESRFASLRAEGIEPVLWDVQTGETELPEADVVLIAVGFDRTSSASHQEVYVDGLRNTLNYLSRPRRLIYISSTGVYGDHQDEWVDEGSPTCPADPSGQACLDAEQLLWETARRRGWDAVVLRLAGIYGPDRLIGAERLSRGDPVAADPDGWLNLIHVEDAARVVEAARLHGSSGETYLVADGHPVVRRDFYRELARAVGAKEPTFDPTLARRHRGGRRISNRKMMAALHPNILYTNYAIGIQSVLS